MEIARLWGTIGANIDPAQRGLTVVDQRLKRSAEGFKRIENNTVRVNTSQASSALSSLYGLTSRVGGAFGSLGSIATTALGTFTGNLLTNGLNAVAGGMGDVVERGLSMRDVLERARIGFTTMTGSAQLAEKHIRELQAFAATTPFEFRGLVKNSQLLQGMGFEAAEVIPTLTAVGNALSASGRTDFLDNVILQLGQMKAKGKVAAQEINILAEAGIPVWRIMSEQVGKTTRELIQLAEQGELNADVFQKLLFEGLQKRYGGSLEKASQTRTGQLSNLVDLYDRRASEATEKLDSELRTTISKAANFLQGEGGQKLTQAVNTSLGIAGITVNETLGKALDNGQFLAKGLDIAGNFIDGFSNGVARFTEKATTAAGGFVDATVGTVKLLLGIQSPSRVMFVIGEQVVEGYIQGIESKKPEIIAAMSAILGKNRAEGLFKRGVAFGPGFFTSGNQSFDQQIAKVAAQRKIDPTLLFAQLLQESGFRQNARSPKDAQGLAQFIPSTAKRFNLNPDDPLDSIRAQGDYMRVLLDMFRNRADLALAGYNAGEGRVQRAGNRVPRIEETQNYVSLITAIQNAIKSGFEAKPQARESESFPGWVLRSIFKGARTGSSPDSAFADDGGPEVPFTPDIVKVTEPIIPLVEPIRFLDLTLPKIAAGMQNVGNAAAEASQKVATSAEQQAANLNQLLNKTQDTQRRALVTSEELMQGLEGAFAGSFNRILEGDFKGFAQGLLSSMADLFSQIATRAATALLFGGEGGGGGLLGKLFGGLFGGGGFLGGLFGGLFGGFRAEGGQVQPGKAYVVGEKGPELFVPRGGGRVLPNGYEVETSGGVALQLTQNFLVRPQDGHVRMESQKQVFAQAGAGLRRALERNG